MSLCTTLALREVDPADYDWSVGDEIAVTAPSVEPVIPAPVTVPGFPPRHDDQGRDGDRPAAGGPAGLVHAAAGVTGVRFQIRVLGTGSVAVEGSTANVDMGYHVVSEGIVANVAYQARARLVGPKTTEWTAWVTVTAPNVQFTSDDIAGGVTQLLADAGMSAVEIVTDLPTTGNFPGRVVYLTTDQKLYRWTGTVWTAAVPTVDLVGQIVAEQVADGAITTAKFAAALRPGDRGEPARDRQLRGPHGLSDHRHQDVSHTGSPSDAAGFTAAVRPST